MCTNVKYLKIKIWSLFFFNQLLHLGFVHIVSITDLYYNLSLKLKNA